MIFSFSFFSYILRDDVSRKMKIGLCNSKIPTSFPSSFPVIINEHRVNDNE